MKFLKTPVAALLLTLACLLAACESYDDEYSYTYSTQFGTLTKEGEAYYLLLDGETEKCLVADSSAIVQAGLTDFPQRILAYYSDINRPSTGENTVSLLQISPMLTKDLTPAPGSEEEREQLGTQYLEIERAWFGGGYLNIMFRYPCDLSASTSAVFSTYDAGSNSQGYHVFEMRHHSGTSAATQWSHITYASFYMPEHYWQLTDEAGNYPLGFLLRYIDQSGEMRSVTIETGGQCQTLQ